MHIPDGFVNAATSAGAAVVAAGGLGSAMRQGTARLQDRQIPFAGLAAAFIFALQMLNFPVAAGTSGHLLGGALAAILLGPAMGITVVSVVVIVQALMFADGGITALGLNVLNMALITAIVGWWTFRLVMAVMPKRPSGVVIATMAASWASVVASSIGFSIQYAIGGQGGVDPGTVLAAMAGVHALIGIGEGIIASTVVAAVLAVRPDLVFGTQRYEIEGRRESGPSKRTIGVFAGAGMAASLVLVLFVAPLASSNPDGLERVAADTGFAATAEEPILGGPFADYGVSGVDSEALGTALAGVVGVVVTFAAGMIALGITRRRRSGHHP